MGTGRNLTWRSNRKGRSAIPENLWNRKMGTGRNLYIRRGFLIGSVEFIFSFQPSCFPSDPKFFYSILQTHFVQTVQNCRFKRTQKSLLNIPEALIPKINSPVHLLREKKLACPLIITLAAKILEYYL
jgi:hypothetical protein